MKRLTYAALALLGAVSEVALHAQPLISWGRVPIYLTVQASARHDDNIFFLRENEISDAVYILTPGVQVDVAGANTTAGLRLGEQIVTYAETSELDSNLTSFSGNFSNRLAYATWSLAAAYTELDQNNFEIRNVNQSVRRNLTRLNANGDWTLTAKSSLGLGAFFERTEFPGAGLVDSDSWTLPIDYYYAITPKVDLSAGYQFRDTKLDPQGGSQDHFVNYGARGRFTSKLDGQIRVGYSKRDSEFGPATSGLGLNADLSYAFSPKTTFTFRATNDFSDSAFGATQKTLRLSSLGRFEFTPETSLLVDLSWERAQYVDVGSREDQFLVANFAVSRTITLNSSLELAYLFRRNRSNVSFTEFNNNVVSLSGFIRF